MSFNRWNYTSANPINRVDPSGHCVNPDGSWSWFELPLFGFGPCLPHTSGSTVTLTPTLVTILTATVCTPSLTPTGTPTPTITPIPTADREPWKHDRDYLYDSNLKGIPNWGKYWKTDSEKRAGKVWNWICTAGGWWGPGCPDPVHLGAIILNYEVGEYWDDIESVRIASTTIRYKLGESVQTILPINLAAFTAFLNPESNSIFNETDWDLLTKRQPFKGAVDEMNYVYKHQQDVFRGPSGQPVIYWWEAIDGDNNSNHTLYYQYTNKSGKTIKFGY